MGQAEQAAQEFLDAVEKLGDLKDHAWGRVAAEQNDTETEAALDQCVWIAQQVVSSAGKAPYVEFLTNVFNQLRNQIRGFGSFTYGAGAQQYQNQAKSFRDLSVKLHGNVGVWAAMSAVKSVSDPGGQAAIDLERVAEIRETIEEHQRRAAKAADAAQTASAKTGVAVFTKQFEDDTRYYRRRAFFWLLMASGFLAAALWVAWCLINLEPNQTSEPRPNAEPWEWIFPLAGRVFILSLLTYATTWCGRMSLASQHSAAVNRHRANSSQTVEALRDSATETPTKDVVVTEAARAIFENVPTGYLGKQTDQPNASRTLEIFRSSN